ncbi:MAG: arylamine N-acetyltransferase family protein [Desulfopila sp.]
MPTDNAIADYLALLQIPRAPVVSLNFLAELQGAHAATLPFGNLGVLLHEDLSLESEALFDRLVRRRRGGYCFEQNKVFFETLQYFGFPCDIVMARVLHNRDVDVPRTHRCTRVHLDSGTYLVDVGFGPLCPREPLRLGDDRPQRQGDLTYRLVQTDSRQYRLQKEEADGWFTLYSFDDGIYTEADCLCGHHYTATYPTAVFVNNIVVSLKFADEVRLLQNGGFHRIRHGETALTAIASPQHLGETLCQEFGIAVQDDQLALLYTGYCTTPGRR